MYKYTVTVWNGVSFDPSSEKMDLAKIDRDYGNLRRRGLWHGRMDAGVLTPLTLEQFERELDIYESLKLGYEPPPSLIPQKKAPSVLERFGVSESIGKPDERSHVGQFVVSPEKDEEVSTKELVRILRSKGVPSDKILDIIETMI